MYDWYYFSGAPSPMYWPHAGLLEGVAEMNTAVAAGVTRLLLMLISSGDTPGTNVFGHRYLAISEPSRVHTKSVITPAKLQEP